jgi:hypothetical protein
VAVVFTSIVGKDGEEAPNDRVLKMKIGAMLNEWQV